MEQPREEAINVLEIGCGLGATLSRIKYLWPNSQVSGIEVVPEIAMIGSNCLDIVQGDVETMEISYKLNHFDYIIFGDVLEHLRNPETVLKKLCPYLKRNGSYLCSITNVMHISVVKELLQGRFEYQDAGILDRTHLRFFTLQSITQLMNRCEMQISDINNTSDETSETEENSKLIDVLGSIYPEVDQLQYHAYQYVFKVKHYAKGQQYENN